MRKVNELTTEDFPGIDQSKFEDWKRNRISTNKKILAAVVILIIVVIVNAVLMVNKVYGDDANNGLFVLCLILIGYMIAILAIAHKTMKLQKNLGMTNKSIRDARSK